MYFLEEAIHGQYWRIIVLEFYPQLAMKADVIGKVQKKVRTG